MDKSMGQKIGETLIEKRWVIHLGPGPVPINSLSSGLWLIAPFWSPHFITTAPLLMSFSYTYLLSHYTNLFFFFCPLLFTKF